jgi:hypothetical protein
MTLSTCRTVSTEEVKRFAEEKARSLGIQDLLSMGGGWANPNLRTVPLPADDIKLRNHQLHLRIGDSAGDM